MRRRFLLFTGAQYYPSPGWTSYVDEFDSVEGAEAYAQSMQSTDRYWDWWQVVDMESRKIVAGGGHSYSGEVVPRAASEVSDAR